MTAYIDYARLLIEVGLCRLGVQVRDERGAMSTEAAVLTGVLVMIAVAAASQPLPRAAAACCTPLAILSIGSWVPITPVDCTSTSLA